MTSLLPPNASPLQRALEEGATAKALPVPIAVLTEPARMPAAFLPFIGWGLSVDDWDASWPLAVRRQIVARAIPIHRRKGTVAAVREAVASFGGSISIREWWEMDPPGEPGSFELMLAMGTVQGSAAGADYIDAAIRQVQRVKPLSRPFSFNLSASFAAGIGTIAVVRPAVMARLNLES